MARRSSHELRADPGDRIGGRGPNGKRGGRSKRAPQSLLGRIFRGRRPRDGEPEPGPRRRRSVFGFLAYWTCVAGLWAVIGVVGVLAWHAAQLPPIDQLSVPKRPPNIAILGDDGALLANRGDTGGPALSIRDFPPYLPKAFVAIEDRRFYQHWGVDVLGVTRAFVRNVTGSGASMQGGSTITQQLAKNLFLTQERTLSRKVQELILAIWLEQRYSKDQILELYMNRVYFGAGAYGVEAAAQRYFGRSARQVSLAESAVLAGLMVAPSRLAPNRNPRGAAERASLVIAAMARDGFITESMAKIALSNPAASARASGAGSVNYVADFVMDALDETIGAIDEDIVVRTTINPRFQALAERALAEELDKQGAKLGVSQGAFVALAPSGEILALVGGRNYSESQFNRATAARRQPGSAFKPFVYLAALERGLTPQDIREDGPVNVRGWRPENSTREFQGPVTLTQALAQSLNTVAVRLTLEAGPKTVAATAHRLGVQSEIQVNASIALGTSEVTPLELVTAYAPFANGGIRVQPHVILRIETARGKPLYVRRGRSFGQVVDPVHVGMMNAMLQETLVTGTGRRAELRGWQAAGKTGTSQDYKDGWFVGYTSQMIAGVWLGNDDASATRRLSGGTLPAEIWARFMREALRGAPSSPLPGESRQPEAARARQEPAYVAKPALTGVSAPASVSRAPATDLLPPAEVGPARSAPPARERGLLERLLGG
jgi:penicillin-binding protein 1A